MLFRSVSFSDGTNTPVTVTTTVSGGGLWTAPTADVSGLDDGTVTITVIQTDVNGNPSAPITHPIELDTAAPPLLTITTPIMGDDIANDAEDEVVIVSGSGAETGATVEVTFDDGVNTPIVVAATVTSGNWVIPATDISGLNEGTITVTAAQTDDAGNVGPDASENFIHDTVGPITTIDDPLEGDNIVNAAEDDTVVITGMGEPGSTVSVTLDDGVNAPITVTAVVDGSGNWQTADIDISGFADGPVSVVAFATDVAGNPGPAATHPGIVHTTTAPPPLVISVVEGDDVVNDVEDNDTVISGTGAVVGATITVTISDGVNADIVVPATIGSGGTWITGDVDITSLNDGPLTVTATQTALGATSSDATRPITHDTAAPNGLALTTPITADNIVNGVEDDALVVAGTGAEPTSSVSLRFSDGVNMDIIVSTTVDGSGNFVGNPVNLSGLNDGALTVTAVETDAAGNPGAPVVFPFTHDTTAPGGLTINAPDPIVDATEDDTLVISGANAEPSSTVQVTLSDGVNPLIVVAATVAGDGTWSIPATDVSGLNDGTITVSAVETDSAGNVGSPVPESFLHDTTAPNGLAIDDPLEGDNIVNAVEDNTTVVSGTGAEPASTILVTLTDGVNTPLTATIGVNGDGTWQTGDIEIGRAHV